MKSLRSKNGFTLIELLTVLVIIMVLVGIIVGASKYAQTKGANTRAQAEIQTMESALESYKNDNGTYPPSTPAPGNPPQDSILLYNALAAGSKTYMTFKPSEVRDGGNTLPPFSFTCGTRVFSYPALTNVMLMDPFGHPYNYYNPCSAGGANNQTFDLWSNGPTGTNGAVDNITNWKPN